MHQLSRSLGFRAVVVIVIANIIGSGVYKKVAPMAAELHSPGWVLAAWLLAGFISLAGALSNAEVAGLLASTGGDYAYYKTIYRRFFAFIYGWSLFAVIQSAAISSLAYVFAQSLDSLLPLPPLLQGLESWSLGGIFYPFADFQIKLAAILLILLLTAVNTLGVKQGARLSEAMLLLVLIGIGAVVVFGLSSPRADVGSVFSFALPAGQEIGLSAFFSALMAAFWAYQGWASVGFLGGEIRDAQRNIPRGLAAGLGIVVAVYLLANIAYLALIPAAELGALGAQQVAAIEAARVFGGSAGALAIALLILLTTLGCAHITILASSRTYFAMAEAGEFFPFAARLNAARAPYGSLWLQGIWASALVLSGSFDQLTDMVIFAVFIYYGATTAGVFVLRRQMPDAPRPYRVPGYPLLPGLMLLFCAALVGNSIVARPREAALGLALILAGAPLYGVFRRLHAKKSQP